MRVIAARDGVHASDEPDELRFETDDKASSEDVLRQAAGKVWLPSIQGGRATWGIVSSVPLAVTAQEWSDLKFLPRFEERMRADQRDGILRLHFNYYAQTDPDVVYRVFWGTKFLAPGGGEAKLKAYGLSRVFKWLS